MSWREFRFNLRPIALLSVGCVIFTAGAVAAATHLLIGLPWDVGFLLGAIVAPPDVVAPLAIARKLGLPRRILVVLEGEGLANDATALILYRFAVVAISTGVFSLPKATGIFAAILIGEVLFGALVGWAQPAAAAPRPRSAGRDHAVAADALRRLLDAGTFRRLRRDRHRRLRPLHQLERTAADLGGDAAAGHLLLGPGDLSDRGPAVSADRIPDAAAVREIEGVSAAAKSCPRPRWSRSSSSSRGSPGCFPPSMCRGCVKRVRARDPSPPWQWAFVIAFTGVRGAVSLAAALALPFALPSGDGFPYRDLILFVVVRRHPDHAGRSGARPAAGGETARHRPGRPQRASGGARGGNRGAAPGARRGAGLARCYDRRPRISDEVVKLLRARHETRSSQLPQSLDPEAHDVSAAGTAAGRAN